MAPPMSKSSPGSLFVDSCLNHTCRVKSLYELCRKCCVLHYVVPHLLLCICLRYVGLLQSMQWVWQLYVFAAVLDYMYMILNKL